MNKNYERCTHCTRRKWLATGCLRKWIKPTAMECKHFQRNIDSKRDFSNTDLVNGLFLTDRKTPINTNKFVKFWKNKLFLTGSVRTLQRYFGNKNAGSEYMCNLNKGCDPSTSSEKRIVTLGYEHKKDAHEIHKQSSKCQHSDGHLVLRGHHHHASIETCAIYCQLSKYSLFLFCDI